VSYVAYQLSPIPPPCESPPCPPEATGIEAAGGWWPLLAVIAVAVLAVGVTFLFVRKRPRRYWVLALVSYLMVGLVSATIGNANIGASLGDMASEPLSSLQQLLAWPVFLGTYLSGNYGR
jgi:hypothetical protein